MELLAQRANERVLVGVHRRTLDNAMRARRRLPRLGKAANAERSDRTAQNRALYQAAALELHRRRGGSIRFIARYLSDNPPEKTERYAVGTIRGYIAPALASPRRRT